MSSSHDSNVMRASVLPPVSDTPGPSSRNAADLTVSAKSGACGLAKAAGGGPMGCSLRLAKLRLRPYALLCTSSRTCITSVAPAWSCMSARATLHAGQTSPAAPSSAHARSQLRQSQNDARSVADSRKAAPGSDVAAAVAVAAADAHREGAERDIGVATSPAPAT